MRITFVSIVPMADVAGRHHGKPWFFSEPWPFRFKADTDISFSILSAAGFARPFFGIGLLWRSCPVKNRLPLLRCA